MQLHNWLPLVIALTPSLASAALFPKDTVVKMIDAKDWKKVMKENSTSVVAFVAPWCGHCQKMAPEFSQAALGVYPMIPFYAVDCDKQSNKRLCSEQGVSGFPTLKLFPRGKDMKPIDFDYPTRTASAFYYWASRNIPHNVKKVYHLEDLPAWVGENIDKPRALLLNQGKGIPLLWQTLGNKYKGQITFAVHRDRYGKSSLEMGLEKGPAKSSKVLYYPPGATDYVRYHGINKHDPLSKFFDSVLDGTLDLEALASEAPPVEEVEEDQDEREKEIERQQEEQRMKLAHGGYNDMIDFEAALKAGINPHAPGGANAEIPMKKPKAEKEEDPIHRILKHQEEEARKEAERPKMAQTGDGAQIVFDPAETGHPKTPVAGESAATPTEEAAPAETASEETTKGHVIDEL
ncbi:Thioredoxin domain-containing protein C13F5.05, mitochondrial [Trametes pubescens]|uniref:Thioredoxin domain-containing protein C13F5.05, mitochondrial n=1 Tax=Trametes pubescens TaxID=154538 RepID=A0A1M2VJE1_TRAPU|nr:Thioredoxin domain-containing protein C13F5.05, mitochondrial [Trametes pubescens]